MTAYTDEIAAIAFEVFERQKGKDVLFFSLMKRSKNQDCTEYG